MDFIPEQTEAQQVPYYDDVAASGGWRGHTTSKSLDALKAEVSEAINRLGGLLSGWQQGKFMIADKERDGFRVYYVVQHPASGAVPGRMDIAALPVRDTYQLRRSLETRRQKSLKMALYMLRDALDGTWFLQQLSPGYSPLIPWMVDERTGKTVSQLWVETSFSSALLPPPDADFVEGEVIDD